MEPDPLTDHDRIVEMHTHVGYIKTKIKSHCDRMGGLDEKIKGLEKAHDKRIDSLEKWKSRVNGVIAGIGLAVGGTWAKLTKII